MGKIISDFKSTNRIFRDDILTFNHDKVFGVSGHKDKPFPSLRIFIIIREDSANISTIELDQFGPILLLETNGKPSFLDDDDGKLGISEIIKEFHPNVAIQELQSLYLGSAYSRMPDQPTDPIYYRNSIDGHESKLDLKYFDDLKDLEKITRIGRNSHCNLKNSAIHTEQTKL